jgi:N-methylhydantoinase A
MFVRRPLLPDLLWFEKKQRESALPPTKHNRSHILAIDIGGTFTDVVLLDPEADELVAGKILTTYPDPSAGVLEGTRKLFADWEVEAGSVGRTIHGTTLITNALIERKGALTGLITTDGFRDALEIGREGRYDIYDLFLERPEPLAQRRLRREVPERLDSRGEVLQPLDEEAVREACQFLKGERVEAVAVVYLHSYVNTEHERRTEELVRELLPDVAVSVSHQVAPEFREYERTSTTVANAYVQPMAEGYLRELEGGLRDLGVLAPLHIMLSNGGSCAVDTASQFPVRLVESGPCGGALSAAYWGQIAGEEDVLAFDMGGTTAKAIITSGGQFPLASESEVARVYRFKKGSGLPLLVPVMDMIEIGAGGGSIAHLSDLGLPVVGPESAGADPGPACYGQGGTQPTVTDSDLVLGMLNADYFLGGVMTLDTAAARRAVAALGEQIDMGVQGAALGIQQLVDENMANAARVHAAERGLDIRSHTLVATGGAGPVHACGLAQRLGLNRVIVPPAAGVGSAFGLMLAPISFDFVRTFVCRLEDLDIDFLSGMMAELEAQGRQIVRDAGVASTQVRVLRSADMRYVGQGFEIRVDLPEEEFDGAMVGRIQDSFDAEYKRLYGRLCDGVSVESVHWRVTVTGPRPNPGRMKIRRMAGHGGDVEKGSRPVFFDDGGSVDVPAFDRYQLEVGFSQHGPLIIEEAESTTVVRPGWSCKVGGDGEILLKRRN